MYFQNLTIGLFAFYLVVSIILVLVLSSLIRLVCKLIFKKELNFKRIVLIMASVLLLIFLTLVITEEPYLSRGR